MNKNIKRKLFNKKAVGSVETAIKVVVAVVLGAAIMLGC